MKKNVLIVTGSDYSQIVYQGFEDAKALGCKLYLLSDGSFDPMPGVFEEHFTYDLRETKAVLNFMGSQSVKFDAVTIKTSEWLTPLTALLAKQYGCVGNDPITAFNCRSKYHMRQQLEKGGIPIPKYKLCRNYEELLSAVMSIGVPCVAKPVGGNASYGTFMIRDKSDLKGLKGNYEAAIKYLKMKAVSEDMFAFDQEEMNLIGVPDHVDMVTDYLVEEYMAGPEISVDAVTQNGKTTIMGIEYQIRMAPPCVMQLAAKLPYVCNKKEQCLIEDLIGKTVDTMGILNSATHTEIIFTQECPKIVEIGCRIGGDDLHDTIFTVTGYNLMFESIMVALGVKRHYEKSIRCHTMMKFLIPAKSGKVEKIFIPPEVTDDPNVLNVDTLVCEGSNVYVPPQGSDYIGYVSAKGKTPEEAERNVNKAFNKIKISIQ
ncbi:MAG: ATP-grasp domain-containing protein [Patescibacteria group bacterium]|nr:ATP-grasp domain-containing protein [Patescibacteria group bacterium]